MSFSAGTRRLQATLSNSSESYNWFHGKISREEAEKLLKSREDGRFLLRESTNFPGDFTLCVCHQGRVEHYHVMSKDKKLTIDEDEYFEDLCHLVDHYRADADGLCTNLKKELSRHRSHDGEDEEGKDVTDSVSFDIDTEAFRKAGWVIERSSVQFIERIGKGEFGDVMLGMFQEQKVAVKCLKDLDRKNARRFMAEAKVMTSLQHENLVRFLGIILEVSSLQIVTEYMSEGSLLDYLRSRGRLCVTKEDQIKFALDTCRGMEYLESKHVIHRDLAARNVLISQSFHAKVADFGLALNEATRLESGKLPIKWTAPEALRQRQFSSKSDMWSFGVLLWEIYSFGRVPYPRIPVAEVVLHVEEGFRMESPDGCPPSVYDIMQRSWDIDKELRPSFSEVCVLLHEIRSQIDVSSAAREEINA